MKIHSLLLLLLLLLLPEQALAQSSVRVCNSATPQNCINPNSDGSINTTSTVGPTGATSTQAKVTIAAGGTYQTGLAASSTRKGCTIQFAQSNTSTHIGYVFFGTATLSDTTTSFTLTPGQALSCAAGQIVLTDLIQLTASNTSDVFVISNQ